MALFTLWRFLLYGDLAKIVPATKWDGQRGCSPFAIAYCEFRWFFSFSLQREMGLRLGKEIAKPSTTKKLIRHDSCKRKRPIIH